MRRARPCKDDAVPRILLAFPTLTTHNRDVIAGARAFARTRPDWQMTFQQTTRGTAPPSARRSGADAVVCHVAQPEHAEAVADGLPAVNTIFGHGDNAVPVVTSDNRRVGELAAADLLTRGFRHLAFAAPSYLYGPTPDARRAGFAGAVAEAGLACVELPGGLPGAADAPGDDPALVAAAGPWLASLGRPAAVLGFNDRTALRLVDLCRAVGLRVPEDVAVMGVQNDETFCELAAVPLSSVALNGRRVGFEAARVLDDLLAGRAAPARAILVEPAGVVTRRSTDVLAIADADVAAAVEFIRRNAGRPIGVGDVLAAVPVGRRSLERRFADALGHGPAAELRRCRVELAKRLLAETDLPLPRVARDAGLGSREYFSALFRRETGRTPAAYRRSSRPGG